MLLNMIHHNYDHDHSVRAIMIDHDDHDLFGDYGKLWRVWLLTNTLEN